MISTTERRLYLVTSRGEAIEYAVGVGRPGFEWTGSKSITRKAEWPSDAAGEMLRRRPDLPRYMSGGEDTLSGHAPCISAARCTASTARTSRTRSGRAVSSGCIRMTNEDVIDSTTA